MDVAEDLEQAAVLQRPAQQPRVLQIVIRDGLVSLKAEMHEVEVLCDDRVGGAREVQRERVLDRAEVVQLEDQVLGQVLLRPPDDPSDTDVRESKLVSGRVDRHDAGDLEVPQVLRRRERRDERARRAVDVDRHRVARALLVLVEQV